MPHYEVKRVEVDATLKEKGLVVVLSTVTAAGTFNQITGTYDVAPTAVAKNVYALILEDEQMFEDGQTTRTTFRRLLLSALDTTGTLLAPPVEGQNMTVLGSIHEVKRVKPLNPGGVSILYKVWLAL